MSPLSYVSFKVSVLGLSRSMKVLGITFVGKLYADVVNYAGYKQAIQSDTVYGDISSHLLLMTAFLVEILITSIHSNSLNGFKNLVYL